MKNFYFYSQRKDLISSNIFTKEIFKIRCLQYFPNSNIFYFIFSQAFLNIFYASVSMIFQEFYKENYMMIQVIQVYNLICILSELYILIILRKNTNKKRMQKEGISIEKIKINFSFCLFIEIFFNLKIFLDFIFFVFIKNTDINIIKANEYEQVFFKFFQTINFFLLVFNVNLFNLFKINLSQKIPLRILFLIQTMMFISVSLFFFVMYLTKNMLIIKNKLSELIIYEIYLIIYLKYVFWILKFKSKIHEIKKYLKKKLLNLKSLVDFLETFIKENDQDGFLSFHIQVNKINGINKNEKNNFLDFNKKKDIKQNKIKILNEIEHSKISVNSNIEFLNITNHKNYSNTDFIQNFYQNFKNDSMKICFNYQNNSYFNKLKKELIDEYNIINDRYLRTKKDGNNFNIKENKIFNRLNQEKKIIRKKKEGLNYDENQSSKNFGRNLTKISSIINSDKIQEQRESISNKKNNNDINISISLKREYENKFSGYQSSPVNKIIDDSLIDIQSIYSKKTANLVKFITKEFSKVNESINDIQKFEKDINNKSICSKVDTVRLENIINLNKQLFLKFKNNNISLNENFIDLNYKNNDILNDYSLNESQTNNYNNKDISIYVKDFQNDDYSNFLVNSKADQGFEKNLFKYSINLENKNINRSNSNPTINSKGNISKLHRITYRKECLAIPINTVPYKLDNIYSQGKNDLIKKDSEIGKFLKIKSLRNLNPKIKSGDLTCKNNILGEIKIKVKKSNSYNNLKINTKNENNLMRSNNFDDINNYKNSLLIFNNKYNEILNNYYINPNNKKIKNFEYEKTNDKIKSYRRIINHSKNDVLVYENKSYSSIKNIKKEDFRFNNFYLKKYNNNHLKNKNSISPSDSSDCSSREENDEKINEIEVNKLSNENTINKDLKNDQICDNLFLKQFKKQEDTHKYSPTWHHRNNQIINETNLENRNTNYLKKKKFSNHSDKLISELKTINSKKNNLNEFQSNLFSLEKKSDFKKKSKLNKTNNKDSKYSFGSKYNNKRIQNENFIDFYENYLSDKNQCVESIYYITDSSGELSSNQTRTIKRKLNLSKNNSNEGFKKEDHKIIQNLNIIKKKQSDNIQLKSVENSNFDKTNSDSLNKKNVYQNKKNEIQNSNKIFNGKPNQFNIEDLNEIAFKNKTKLKDVKLSSDINIILNSRSSSCNIECKKISHISSFEKKSLKNRKFKAVNKSVRSIKYINNFVNFKKFSKSHTDEENYFFNSKSYHEKIKIDNFIQNNKNLLSKQKNFKLPSLLKKNCQKNFSKNNKLNRKYYKSQDKDITTYPSSKPFGIEKQEKIQNFQLMIFFDTSAMSNIQKDYKVNHRFLNKERYLNRQSESKFPRSSIMDKVKSEVFSLFKNYKYYNLNKFIEELLIIFDNIDDFDYITSIGPFHLILVDLNEIIPENFKFNNEILGTYNKYNENKKKFYNFDSYKTNQILEDLDLINSLMKNSSRNCKIVSKEIYISTLKLFDDNSNQILMERKNPFIFENKNSPFNTFSEPDSNIISNESFSYLNNFKNFNQNVNKIKKNSCFKWPRNLFKEFNVKKYILLIKHSSNHNDEFIENPKILNEKSRINKNPKCTNVEEVKYLFKENQSGKQNIYNKYSYFSDSYDNNFLIDANNRLNKIKRNLISENIMINNIRSKFDKKEKENMNLRAPLTTGDRKNIKFNLINSQYKIFRENNYYCSDSLNHSLCYFNKSHEKFEDKSMNINSKLVKYPIKAEIDVSDWNDNLRNISSSKNKKLKDKKIKSLNKKFLNNSKNKINSIINFQKSEKNKQVNNLSKNSSNKKKSIFNRNKKIQASSDSMEIFNTNSLNKITSNSKFLPRSCYNINNKISSISSIGDEIKELNEFLINHHEIENPKNGNADCDIEHNLNQDNYHHKNVNSDFFNKLSALLHDFKHIVYDNMIYFDYLILQYIHPIIISPDNQNSNIHPKTIRFNSGEIDKLKDELIYLSVIKDYTISLILNITNFMSDNEFLSGSLDEIVDITSVINLMEKIFNRRLEYENSMTNKFDNTLNNNLNINSNINSNFISFKKNIMIKSKIRNDDNISDLKIKSNKNLIMSLLYNIISNSYKYTDKGSILIEAEIYKKQESNFILIKISDTGKGIPQEILKNWGKPFNFKDKTVGTGLGQFLIHSISKKLKFEILQPESNKFSPTGTVFKILIPITMSDFLTQKINFHNSYENNLKNINSNSSVKNKHFNLQEKIVQKNNENKKNDISTKINNNYEQKKTLNSRILDTLNLTIDSEPNLIINNKEIHKNLFDSLLNITTEIPNINFNVNCKLKAFSIFNNININELKSRRSNPDNHSSSNCNTINRKNSKLLEILSNHDSYSESNHIKKNYFLYKINKNGSENNTPKNSNNNKLLGIDPTNFIDRSSYFNNDFINNNEKFCNQRQSIQLIKNKSNSFTRLVSPNIDFLEKESETKKTINILCLDDELIFLQGIEKNLKNVATEFKEYNFNLIFTNCLQDFFREFSNLLFKNLKVDFFIMDQNISQNMKGIDCCKMANEFYKLYFKDSYLEMNFQFFFVTEDPNLTQFKIFKSERNLVCKDHIFGKLQLKKLCDVLIKCIKNFELQ